MSQCYNSASQTRQLSVKGGRDPAVLFPTLVRRRSALPAPKEEAVPQGFLSTETIGNFFGTMPGHQKAILGNLEAQSLRLGNQRPGESPNHPNSRRTEQAQLWLVSSSSAGFPFGAFQQSLRRKRAFGGEPIQNCLEHQALSSGTAGAMKNSGTLLGLTAAGSRQDRGQSGGLST